MGYSTQIRRLQLSHHEKMWRKLSCIITEWKKLVCKGCIWCDPRYMPFWKRHSYEEYIRAGLTGVKEEEGLDGGV